MENDFFTKQILTYLGNKRKFLTKIDEIIKVVKDELGEKNIHVQDAIGTTQRRASRVIDRTQAACAGRHPEGARINCIHNDW